ncbi:MAG: hypothetical protein KJO08_09460 [Gammaproteobacteria bacterium]|nr:hypothetical protein [Gammaproteobacteria bacterium]NNJ84849.1 hypothetical protein [Gammaproteobacteria bacterium]
MKLPEEEATLFFDVMWPLQHYANKKLGTIPGVESLEDLLALDSDKKFLVRESLFENPRIIDRFVAENPNGFDDERLSIAHGWRHFIEGDFYIERFLKKYAVFVQSEQVYAVFSLRNSFDEMFPRSYLPMHVKAILLPFRDKIIYDGFMRPYNVLFGDGIKSDLKEIYMKAKQNGKIIFSLGTGDLTSPAGDEPIPSVDWSRELQELMAISKTLKGGAGQPMINAVVFGLVRASIEFADKALSDSMDINMLLADFSKVQRALKKVEDTLYRME